MTRYRQHHRPLTPGEAWVARLLNISHAQYTEHMNRSQSVAKRLSLRDHMLYRAAGVLGVLQESLLSAAGEPVWRSTDGRIVRIRDMSDSHLHNAIRMLQRAVDPGQGGKLRQLIAEASRRHEGRFA